MILKFKKGFSLVELLVVIAIIGILAAVGITAYQGYTTGAKEKAVLANQKQIVSLINAEMAKCAGGTGTYPWGKHNTGTRIGGDIAWDGLDKCDRTTNGHDTGDFASGEVSAEAIADYINYHLQLKNPWNNTDTEIAIKLSPDKVDKISKNEKGEEVSEKVDDVGFLEEIAYVGRMTIGCKAKKCVVTSMINKDWELSTTIEIAYY
jgi:prepilin-type N-terminal cleavage/methylation domain-containing protein